MYKFYYSTTHDDYVWVTYDPLDAYAMQCALMMLNITFTVHHPAGQPCMLINLGTPETPNPLQLAV